MNCAESNLFEFILTSNLNQYKLHRDWIHLIPVQHALIKVYTKSFNLGWILVLMRLTLWLALQCVRELVRPTTAFPQLCRLASCCSAGDVQDIQPRLLLLLVYELLNQFSVLAKSEAGVHCESL